MSELQISVEAVQGLLEEMGASGSEPPEELLWRIQALLEKDRRTVVQVLQRGRRVFWPYPVFARIVYLSARASAIEQVP